MTSSLENFEFEGVTVDELYARQLGMVALGLESSDFTSAHQGALSVYLAAHPETASAYFDKLASSDNVALRGHALDVALEIAEDHSGETTVLPVVERLREDVDEEIAAKASKLLREMIGLGNIDQTDALRIIRNAGSRLEAQGVEMPLPRRANR
jgi:hypothetical protein